MNRRLLSAEDLTVSFGTNGEVITAVNKTSFLVEEEDFLVIVGESGSGKTLTALSIMRLLPPEAACSGRILYRGEDLLAKSDEELRHIRGKDISMVFQEPMTSLNPVFTVGFQIAESLLTHQSLSKKEAMERAVDLLRSVKIPSPELRVREYPHQMSGGMRQRVMIAMAIACSPSLIIADEPTTALDVTIQAQILELLGRLKASRKMSLLLITHDLGIVAEYAQRVEVMYAGRIVEKATAREIFLNPRHPYTMGLLESLPERKGKKLTPIPGQVPQLSELPRGCTFSPRCRYVIDACREREPDLIAVEDEHASRCIRTKEI